MPDITLLNNILSNVGKSEEGHVFYRIVWSDKQLEYRDGEFNEFCGPLFLRTIKGVREVPKYPYLPERWILERWVPGLYAYTPEIPLSKWGSYEPLYVFEDSNGNYLEPTRKVVEFIVHRIENPLAVMTEKQRIDALKEADEKEVQAFLDMLSTSDLEDALHHGDAISMYSGNKLIN